MQAHLVENSSSVGAVACWHRSKLLRKRLVKVGRVQLLPRDYVTWEVGVLGPWVRIVSAVVGEETVMARCWDGCALCEQRTVGQRQFGPVTHAQPGAGRARVGGCIPTTRARRTWSVRDDRN